VLALYSPNRFVKVFINARGGLFIMIYKASNRFIIIYKSRAVRY
jgi:hypothetical protein